MLRAPPSSSSTRPTHLTRCAAASIVFALALFCAPRESQAQTPPLFPGGTSALPKNSVTTHGDFDGDGRIDLVAFDVLDPLTNTSCVRLFRGDGFGRFAATTFTYPLSTATTASSNALSALDLLGDTRPEVVFCTSTTVPISITYFVLRFEVGVGFVLVDSVGSVGPGQPLTFTSGDFDGDGDVDLAAVLNGNGIGIATQTAPGVFSDVTSPLFPGIAFSSAVAADLDADGFCDLALGESFFAKVHVLFGGPNGMFTVGPTLLIDSGPFSPSHVVPGPLAIGDLDEDDTLDLVVPTHVTAQGVLGDVTWYRGDGSGLFTEMQRFAAGIGARAVAVADLDHDGHLDVQCGGSGGLLAAFGDGLGSFTTPYPADAGGTVSAPYAGDTMALAHLDGDDVFDVIAFDGPVGVRTYLGTAPGRYLTPPLQSGSSPAALASTTLDADGDGDLDYVTYSLNTGYRCALNDGSGVFANTVTSTGPVEPVYAIGAGKIDAGSLRDVVAVPFGSSGIEWRSNLGGGAFGAQHFVARPPRSGPLDLLAVGDLDGDGDDDVVATSIDAGHGLSVFENVAGSLAATQFVSAGGFHEPLDIALADLTGDGALDVLCASNFDANGIRMYPSLGGCTFGPPLDIGPAVTVRDIACGDLDLDGDTDLALTTRTSVPNPNGAGQFVKIQVRSFLQGPGGGLVEIANVDVNATPEQLAIVDIDQDGDGDVVGRAFHRAIVFTGNGTGALTFDGDYGLGTQKADGIAAANFDADPDIELAYHRWTDPQVHLLDHHCPGRAGRYGHGCPGTGGLVPELTTTGCIRNGETVTFALRNALPNSIAILFFGVNPVNTTTPPGCVFQMAPLFPASIVLPTFALPNGTGGIEFSVPLGTTIVPGMRWTEQAVCADPALPWGYTVTNPLEFVGG